MPTVIPVRMHFNAQDLWFNPGKSQAKAGDHVIVATERGTEFGLATADPFNVPDNEMKGKGELKLVVRIATDKDIARAEDMYRANDRERLKIQIETGDVRAARDRIITQPVRE